MQRFDEGVAVPPSAFPEHDEDVAAFVAATGAPGILDVHVHAMPDRLQQAVWRYFDALDDPPWPIAYRGDLDARLAQLRGLGVLAHPALAYAHRAGMAADLNHFTLGLAERSPQVLPTCTLYPDEDVTQDVDEALQRGAVVCKVHTQLSRYHLTDPRLDDAWRLLAAARTVVVAHVSAVYGVDGGAQYTGAEALRALKRRHPDVRVVVAHLGLPDPDGAMWDAIAELDGVWTDLSMALTDPLPAATRRGPFASAELDRLTGDLAERLLFGSDFPSVPHDYTAQLRGLAALGLDPAGLRAVLHDRTAALLHDAGWDGTTAAGPPA